MTMTAAISKVNISNNFRKHSKAWRLVPGRFLILEKKFSYETSQ